MRRYSQFTKCFPLIKVSNYDSTLYRAKIWNHLLYNTMTLDTGIIYFRIWLGIKNYLHKNTRHIWQKHTTIWFLRKRFLYSKWIWFISWMGVQSKSITIYKKKHVEIVCMLFLHIERLCMYVNVFWHWYNNGWKRTPPFHSKFINWDPIYRYAGIHGVLYTHGWSNETL